MLNKKLIIGVVGTTFLLTFMVLGDNLLAQSTSTTSNVCAFPQNIQIGDSGGYVTCLQNYLIVHQYLDRKKAGDVYDEETHVAFTSFRTDLKLGGTNATPVYMLPFFDDAKKSKHSKND
jgi:hypothetical protein